MDQLKVKVEKRKVGFGDNRKDVYVSKADRGGSSSGGEELA